MLLDQGAAAVQIDAKIGRSAISFLNNEPVNDLVAADAAFQPTKVIVMLGTNDIGRDLGATQQAMAQIRDAYQGMGAEVWAIGPMAYVGRSEGLNALAPDVFGVMQSVFGADKTIDARPLAAVEGRTGDGVHFTYAAALPTAQALAQALVSTSSTSMKLKKGLIIAGVGVAGIAIVGYALRALKRRQLLGPIGMLISPRFVGPALMAYDARRNLESRPTPGGKAWGRKPSDFDPFELRRGIEVEYEHTSDRRAAQKIAMDHLVEDPRYYRKLAKIHVDGLGARPKKGDRFNYFGETWQVLDIRRDGKIVMARPTRDPFGKTVLIDHREFHPRDMANMKPAG